MCLNDEYSTYLFLNCIILYCIVLVGLMGARVGIGKLHIPGEQLSLRIISMCVMPEANCVLALWRELYGRPRVVRVSLAEKLMAFSLYSQPGDERMAHLSDIAMLPDGVHIAIAIHKPKFQEQKASGFFARMKGDRVIKRNEFYSVRLLSLESDTWRFSHKLRFEVVSDFNFIDPRICVSQNLLLCAAFHPSRRLVALQVTVDSKLQKIGEMRFDSAPSALCAFISGTEHLVATAHKDCTVRIWKHLEAAAAGFSLKECSRVTADTMFKTIVRTASGLLLQPENDKTVRLCRLDSARLVELIPQPQLGSISIECGCTVGRSTLVYDNISESLLSLDS